MDAGITLLKTSSNIPARETPTVLVAEDEVLVRFALSDMLAACGFKVLEAGDATEAIHLLESEPDVDLVFSDVRMPGQLNGIDLAHWVHEHRPGLAVVLTSGDKTASDDCADEEFIPKPYDLERVVGRLRDLARLH